MHIVVQDPSLFVRSNREGLGLFLRADIESLVVDALEAALDHCIFLILCLKDALVQIDVFLQSSFFHRSRHCEELLRCIVQQMLLIDQTVHLRSKSHELRDAMSVVLILQDETRQLLVEVEERFQ